MRLRKFFLIFIILAFSLHCLAYEVGENVLFQSFGDTKLGVITDISGRQYFLNEPAEFIDYADGKVFYSRDLKDYNSVGEYTESKFLGFGRNETWSIGDKVMIEWNGGLQKAEIGDLTADGLVYFKSVSRANRDSFGLGNKYFPLSIIRNRYEGLDQIESNGQLFRLGDRVLLFDRYNSLYDDQDLYLGSIIDINTNGEIRIDYLHKRDRFYNVSDIKHLQSVRELDFEGRNYYLGQEVVVRWNRSLHRTTVIDIDASGYILVDKFKYQNGYIEIDNLVD